MRPVRRRTLVACAGALPFAWLFSRKIIARESPLVPDPDGVLDLLEGFSYTVLEERFSPMTDGFRVPDLCDGMACFDPGDGTLVLMRNHEISPGHRDRGPVRDGAPSPPNAYDPRAHGGVTRLVLDAETLDRRSSNLVLAGTYTNCSGGLSPWGWLSCEEIVIDEHGYVFLCPVDAATVAPPKRIDGYGRFRHEAAHVDPRTLIAYLTEDEIESSLFRFVPSGSSPFEGSLQALAIDGARRASLTNMEVGQRLDVTWVEIEDPSARTRPVGVQARERGAAVLVRGEGLWLHEGVAYFCASGGGPYGLGQIFRLEPHGDGGVLELVAMGTDPDLLRAPDNIAVHPNGGIVVAEDGPGHDMLRGIDADGLPFDFARNALSDGELSGVCFDPTGRVMFVNLQQDGLTLAVRGPMDKVFG